MLKAEFVSRPRLLRRLKGDAQLVYVWGPASSGKTALLEEWSEAQSEAVCWLVCSDADNEPLCLLQRLKQIMGLNTTDLQLSTAVFRSVEAIAIASLCRWIEQQQELIHLVVDDYQILQSEESRTVIRSLLQMQPKNLRVYIASQFRDETLPLSRWTLNGQACEITATDLLFTVDEMRELITASELSTTEHDMQALFDYTNGWIAGVKLALLHSSVFSPSARPNNPYQIVNDLCASIFYALEVETQLFLTQVSILDVLTEKVCEVVSRNDSSRRYLAQLHDRGLLISVDSANGTFRIPTIWRQFLQTKLQDAEVLYVRAARWYENNSDLDNAIRYAIKGDSALAVELIQGQGKVKIAQGELVKLRSWLEALPEQTVSTSSPLSLIYAWALVHSGNLDRAERYLHHPEHSHSDVYAIRARIAAIRGNKVEQAEFSQKALQHIPETDFSLRAEIMLNLGCVYLELGKAIQAAPILSETLRLSRTAQNTRAMVFSYFFVGKLRAAQGRLAQALQTYEEGITSTDSLSIAGVLHVGLAEILYEYNDLSAAKAHLDQALAMGEPGSEIKPLVYANIALGLLLPPDDAIQRLAYIASLTGWTLIYAWQTLWWLRTGNIAMASYWLEDSQTYDLLSEFERMVQARVLIALQRWTQARQLLDDLVSRARQDQRRGDLIKILLLDMQFFVAQGHQTEALYSLSEALRLGEAEGYFRTFVDEGEIVHKLCLQLTHEHPNNDYLRRILQYFSQNTLRAVPLSFGETLSPREIEVLLLIVEGFSNEAIAQQLFLTIGTVKWHVHNIFGKLDARNRAQAIKRARELQILFA